MAFQLNGIAPLAIQIKDSSGALADATTVTLTLTRPDGTTETPTVLHPSTGVYRVDYVPLQAGYYTLTWTATGSNAGVFTDSFEANDAQSLPIVSLADLRRHMNWDTGVKGTEDDDELLELAGSATDIIQDNIGRPIRRMTVTEEYSDGTTGKLLLRQVPCPCISCTPNRVLTITSVSKNGSPLGASAYSLNASTGILTCAASAGSTVSVVYVAGYKNIPSWASMAVKRLTEHLWTRSQQARHSRGQTPEPTEFAAAASYLLPYAIQSLITPHRSAGW